MNYRDIRTDLLQRVADIKALRKAADEEYRVKIRELDEREKALHKLLDDENRRFPEDANPPTTPAFAGTPTNLVLHALQDGEPMSLETIKGHAELMGLRAPEGGHIGRILHGALVSLMREGRVERLPTGEWQRVSEEALVQARTKELFE